MSLSINPRLLIRNAFNSDEFTTKLSASFIAYVSIFLKMLNKIPEFVFNVLLAISG